VLTGLLVVQPVRGFGAQTADGLFVFVFRIVSTGLLFSWCRRMSYAQLPLAPRMGRPSEEDFEMVRCPCLLRAVAFVFWVRTGLNVVRPGRGAGAQTADGLLVFVCCPLS